MSITPFEAEHYFREYVTVHLTDWIARQKDCETTVHGLVTRVTDKALLLDDTDDLDDDQRWIPLSQIEDIYSDAPGGRASRHHAPHGGAEPPPPRQPPPSSSRRDPYAILGVLADATAEQISAAYRTGMKALHPDVNPAARADAEVNRILTARAADLNWAYHQLARSTTGRPV